ncbi:ribonuclease H-like protein [Xylariaceae sp. FL0662B]|nr:ribonuclease H-like protein [Xylariaceae sp. FL0662B]
MKLSGNSDAAGNALRCSNPLRTSSPWRSYILPRYRMTATPPPPKHQLWHPGRGISFSPVLRSPSPAAQAPRPLNEAAATANQEKTFGVGPVKSERRPVAFNGETTPPAPNDVAPSSAAAEAAAAPETIDENAASISPDKKSVPETKISDDPPIAVLDYKMVDDLFYAAKKAPAGSPESFWSYAHYRGKGDDGTEQKVKVHYCRSAHTMERVCQQYFKDEKLLGFDLEWIADAMKWQGVKKNVSLIQLASPTRIGLFHVALFTDSTDMVGPTFRKIMEDSGIAKTGVWIKGDATRLRNFLGIESKGLMELSHLFKLVTYSSKGQYQHINKRLVPLATQVEQYLHLPLFKGSNVRSSDWTKPLTMDQVIYSASDAYAAVHLYATLDYHRKQLSPCPPVPYPAERNLPIRLADGIELATSDEPADTPDEATADPSGPYIASVLSSIQIEDLASSSTPSKSKSPSRKPKDSRVEAAEDRVNCYRAANPHAKATFVHLRAYYLWHAHGLDPRTIAQLLRDPPLHTSTVAGYVLAAIQYERLPFDAERLRLEVLAGVGTSEWRARYPYVAEKLLLVEGAKESGSGSGAES